MPQGHREKLLAGNLGHFSRAIVLTILAAAMARCGRAGPATQPTEVTLRIGLAAEGSSETNALNGVPQLLQLLSAEALARIGEDGRPAPWLAQSWNVSQDGLSTIIRLRPRVKFHDGSSANAAAITAALNQALPRYMGPAFADVQHITPRSDDELEIRFRRPSPFLLEVLEVPIQKSGSRAGTGPFMIGGVNAQNEMRANNDYYLGAPAIGRAVVSTYPNVRSAWAELLRDRIDMLYEVGVDALDSLTSARSVSVFTFVRHYQYVLIFNTNAPPLRSREIRRALNQAIDPDALVREAFDGHAVPSSGPIWPQHWAFRTDLAKFTFNPREAASTISGRRSNRVLRFTCFVRPGLERLALVMKRQLEAVGVEMVVQEVPVEGILEAVAKHDFDATLLEPISGPSLFRTYELWHSGSLGNPGGWGSAAIDAALDRIRYATNDEEYRIAVEGLQKTIVEDPPAIFLAWSERARAVSRRFQVPAEPGRDVLTTLRLWKPVNDERFASRN